MYEALFQAIWPEWKKKQTKLEINNHLENQDKNDSVFYPNQGMISGKMISRITMNHESLMEENGNYGIISLRQDE